MFMSNLSSAQSCWFYNLGLVPYEEALGWQQQMVSARKAALEKSQAPDVMPHALILLEHPPVYTLGQGASQDFLKFDPQGTSVPLYRVERGGEVTYHCPGQLVAYPIFDLRYFQQDLHWYLRQLEEVVIRVLAAYGLVGERLVGLTGVWLKGHKVAAIGIKVSRWITMHGLALNVCPDLSGFELIVPCGIADRPVGSLAQFLPEIDLQEVRQTLARAFIQVFNLDLIPVSL
uniref:Octanoyltransferase n=1 Tax=Cyanothece sp. (strain PCC 7425 / ATCC 29141) TaxID=395961 RepID=B8HK27_CYAP4